NVIEQTKNYILQHAAIAQKLQKPMVLEEFGLPRDKQSFDPASPTTLRDRYYDTIFSYLRRSADTGGVIGGAGFWAFGGTARPHKGQIFWKAGDDYMGDPPMEEQGLNTVFDIDASTWKIISRYAKELKQRSTAFRMSSGKNAVTPAVAVYGNVNKAANGLLFDQRIQLAFGVAGNSGMVTQVQHNSEKAAMKTSD
ncbi:MAG TPA: hypothetical protein VFL47_00360, partial [Flavisolibacter sp.]|nr:hypothetical protein [Flavisolibacter sp.]